MLRSFSISLSAEIISGFTSGLLLSLFACSFLALSVGAKVVLEIGGTNRLEGQRDFAAFRLENHVRSANAGKPSAMRLRSFDRQRRVYANIPPGESLVVGGTKQRAVQAGRTYFERIRIRKRVEGRIDTRRDPLAQQEIDAVRPIDHQLQLGLRSAPVGGRRDDLDVGEFALVRQPSRHPFECVAERIALGFHGATLQAPRPLPYSSGARDSPTLLHSTNTLGYTIAAPGSTSSPGGRLRPR